MLPEVARNTKSRKCSFPWQCISYLLTYLLTYLLIRLNIDHITCPFLSSFDVGDWMIGGASGL